MPDADLLPGLGPALDLLTTAGTPGSYLDDPVLPELAEVLLAQWPYAAGELSVVDGAMDAMDLIARAALRFGDRVVVEHPCFPPLVDLLESVGVQVVPVPVDEEGLGIRALREALASPVTAVFLQPRAQNPTGVTMSEGRAAALAGLLDGSGALVVEDDSASAPAGEATVTLGRWLPEHTAYIRSFSKSHGPDLRLAALSAPADLPRPSQRDATWARGGAVGCSSGSCTPCSPTGHRSRRSPRPARSTPGAGPGSSTSWPVRVSTWAVRRASTSGCRCTTRRRR